MFKLRCSFCRRHAADVAKLVAGPRVFICDRCVAIATELMQAPADPEAPGMSAHPKLRTWRDWFKGRPVSQRVDEAHS